MFSSLIKIVHPLEGEEPISQVPFVVNNLLFYKWYAHLHTHVHTHTAAFSRKHYLTEENVLFPICSAHSCRTFPEAETC